MFSSELRSRKREINSDNMSQIHFKLAGTAARLRQMSKRMKCFFLCLLFVSIFIYGNIFWYLMSGNHLTTDSYLETDKCPACYGHSMCRTLYDNRVKMTGWSTMRFFDMVNRKNVHYAHHAGGKRNIVLKKLGHDKELVDWDERICREAGRTAPCDVTRMVYRTNTAREISKIDLQPRHLKGLSFMFMCPTYRLIDYALKRYKEVVKPDLVLFRDKVQFVATAMMNSEPLLLQTFPASEGWPFPEYYGACGRFIAVSDEGRPLQEFYNSPFEKRADLAYQILKMADLLTTHHQDFVLYWTDLSYENLAVDSAGKVRIIDAEHIIVVDKKSISKVRPKGWDDLLESTFDDCGGKNCLNFNVDGLCSHTHSDHNYYAACRNLLSKFADESAQGMPGGLLHDMPKYARNDFDLEYLLNECTRPSSSQKRLHVKDDIINALDEIRNLKMEKDPKSGERES
ncbi:hypothetical protein ScPMuIL_018653 [Solemya velum]